MLVLDYGHRFHPILTIEDYTGFFLAIILGLGIAFELPILMFFLALFGFADGKFLLRNFKYGTLVIFVIAGVICPLPDLLGMCLFACPVLALYLLGIGLTLIAHPCRRRNKVKLPSTELGVLIFASVRFPAMVKARADGRRAANSATFRDSVRPSSRMPRSAPSLLSWR